MSVAAVVQQSQIDNGTGPVGVSLRLDALTEPGTYVCNWSGHLLRVPESDRGTSRFSTTHARRAAAWTVTRISVDPRISCYHAKSLADRLGLTTSF